ncbi:MAG: DNA polymerase/3'-5' exonuclease PolX, partial [Candidatus Nanohaloarchaea archaeon]|nr:DNA polymerase/3'-5' exonuclease PolX [Candidatus Nanohaloarchaea archaeon]
SEDIEDVADRGELEEISGVGAALAEKIREYLETGTIEYYQKLKEELPVDIEALTRVEGVGPKTVKKLYKELGIEDLEDLEEAAEEGKIAAIEGFGEKTEENILDHIGLAKKSQERMILGEAVPIAREIVQRLEETGELNRLEVAGSYRRRKPTVGDLDILATAEDPEKAMEEFVSLEGVKEVLNKGDTKSSVVLFNGLQVDLRIVEEDSYGSALQYFTGSKDHNIVMRSRAVDRGLKLNEYGLFDGEDRVAGEKEGQIYEKLGLSWIEPELRENTGEIEEAGKDQLPELVERKDLKGDLQMHTEASDGSSSIKDMAEKAEEMGYEYILITDHGPELDIAGGLGLEEFKEQKERIEELNGDMDIEILHGAELDVTEEGLSFTPEQCEMFDLLLAAVHIKPENPTESIIEVFEEYPVDIFGHPLNRKLNEREPLDLDLDRVVKKAEEENIAIEINAQPRRLDLPWNLVKKYREKVKFVISTDAHSPSELDLVNFGVWQARKGWCSSDNILNTSSLEEVKAHFD